MVEAPIVIPIRAIDLTKNTLKTVIKNMKALSDLGLELSKTKGGLGLRDVKTGQYSSLTKALKGSNKEFDKMSKTFKTLSITLPLMFAFQNVAKAMKSAIDPAMEMMGVNELYQQFLALKYLPTAEEQLENVLDLGDEWENQSESQRKAEGDAILMADRLSELVSYLTQCVNTGAAFGKIIPFVGESMGTAAGLAFGLTTGLGAMNSITGQTMITFGGLGQAISIQGIDAMAKFLIKVGVLKDTDLPQADKAITTTKDNMCDLYNQLTKSGGTIEGVRNLCDAINDLHDKNVTITTTYRSVYGSASYESLTPEPFRKYIYGAQHGGIFTRPTTTLLGERGPEAVIPLDRIGSIGGINVTINTSSIGGNTDMIAREIAEKFAFELSRVRY